MIPKRFKKRFRRVLNPSYLYLLVIFVLASIVVIQWTTQKERAANEQQYETIHSYVQPIPSVENPWLYFHPVWKKTSAAYAAPSEIDTIDPLETQNIVKDPLQKIERDFQAPVSIRPRVAFWVSVYSRYNSATRILHDRDDPGIIYGYMDFNSLARVLGANTLLFDAKAYELERKIIRELKQRLAVAMGISSNKDLQISDLDEIRRFLSQVGAYSPGNTQRLINNVRSQTGQSDMFLKALTRSKDLLPHIEAVFRMNHMPVGLARIPFVESSFNVRARSKVGAMGMWQFMPETARLLIHRSEEQQWSDPLRQTRGAARLLKQWRAILPDWGTTVTAYNQGAGRIRGILNRRHVRTAEQMLNLPEPNGLGFAGQNFFAEVVAANIVEAYKEELFGPLLKESPFDSAIVFKTYVRPPAKDTCSF